ncbi:MAG: hypothetical protein SAJ12_09015 [Jaaginema sp. PMC 1079.18]|nr:hypothetical protein [Jaaginema sp. PMC 1080.18]MEC4851141.1 hypothetical protein [Jaaginema sp. PMC 1079.18]MEC4866380.1 hypothetical protein [Jaaginema sp. PMC 1078.18]
MIILPGDPLFDATLAGTLPPTSQPAPFYIARGEHQILEPASEEELAEYLYGGEYDYYEEVLGEGDECLMI